MIGARKPLLFLGLLFLFSSLPGSGTPTDARLDRLMLELVRASPSTSKVDEIIKKYVQ